MRSDWRSAQRSLAGIAAALYLSSCATLPTREASAFSALAKADSTALNDVAKEEIDVMGELASIQPGASGISVRSADCQMPTPAKPCVVKATGLVGATTLQQHAKRTRELLAAVATYGAAMAALAEAKDVKAAQDRVDSVSGAIEKLFAVTGVGAPAAGALKAVSTLIKGGMRDSRRGALLAAARQADPAIATIADLLGTTMTDIRANLIRYLPDVIIRQEGILGRADDAIAALAKRRDALSPGASFDADRARLEEDMALWQDIRTRAAAAVVAAGIRIEATRTIKTDFASLDVAHKALLKSLKSPKPDVSATFTALGELSDAVSSAKGK